MDDETSTDPTVETPADERTPRWVKIMGGALALMVLIVVIGLVAGGKHGPSRHSGDDKRADKSAGESKHDLSKWDHG